VRIRRCIGYCLMGVIGIAAGLGRAEVPPSPQSKQAAVKLIAGGFEFTEGPCWRAAGYLVFSDINGNTIYKWSPEQETSVLLRPSGNSNGIAEDRQGRLLIAQHSGRRVVRLAGDGSLTVLAGEYQDKRLNSPNDLTVHSNGAIYFTDPLLGIRPQDRELDFAGIYRISADGAALELLDRSMELPNGVALAPDERSLYVTDTRKRQVIAFDLTSEGKLANRRIVVSLAGSGEFDGLKVDRTGNLWIAYSEGFILIFSPSGRENGRIAIPERPRNLAWGNPEQTKLFVTAGTGVYLVEF
jgi:gluconolactonase